MSKIVHSLSRLFWLTGIVLIAAASPLPAATPSMPKLVPAFPDAAAEWSDDEFSPDSAVLTDVTDEPMKPLPLSARRLTPAPRTVTARQTSYDAPPVRDEIVIPQGFLDEEEPSPLETLPMTKPQTKKKTLRTIETAEGITPQPDYSGYFVNTPAKRKPVNSTIPLNEGEFFVADTEYPVDAATAGGVYNEVSPSFNVPSTENPALTGSYSCPMVVKSFGTGALDNLTFFGGVSGFKAETDYGTGTNGNFGFNEGFNWSGPATPLETVYAQAGFRAIQSGVLGNTVTEKDSRNQFFVTAGVFKRFPAYPIQGGAVIDYLSDDLMGKTEVCQARYELSARTFRNLEYGFLGTAGLSKQSNHSTNYRGNLYYGTIDGIYSLRAQQSYQIFIRKHLAFNGTAEIRSGATDHGDAILAAMGEFPVGDRLSFTGGFSALLPKEGHGHNGWKRESWDVSFGAVFYFRGGATAKTANLYRPMFDVAGNGTFYNRLN